MCVKKPSLSSLNVDSGRDLGASSVCSCSSSCLGPVASTALEGHQPPGVHSSSAELWEMVPQPRQFLLPVSLPALASSPDEKEPFSLLLSHAEFADLASATCFEMQRFRFTSARSAAAATWRTAEQRHLAGTASSVPGAATSLEAAVEKLGTALKK
ncbi:hypothetical protein AB1E18_018016 [Capra hircus]